MLVVCERWVDDILTQSSSDHCSTSFTFWLGCSTVGHWGPKPSVWSWFSLCGHPISNWNSNSRKPSVAYGYIIVYVHLLPVGVRICTKFNHVHRSRWYSDIFDQMHLFRCYTGATLDWRLGRGSICYIISKTNPIKESPGFYQISPYLADIVMWKQYQNREWII